MTGPRFSPAPQRWQEFTRSQQILMIGTELHRATKLMEAADAERRRNTYARALALTDLTVHVNPDVTFRRELLRWRDLAAQLYVNTVPDPEKNAEALRTLLRFTFEASRQLHHLRAGQP